MSKVLVTEQHLMDIASAIREKLDSEDAYRPGDMATAIRAIEGYPEPTGTVTISQNGTANVKDYATAAVNVQPNLQQKTATQNGTVRPDTGYDGLSSVVVDVSEGGTFPYTFCKGVRGDGTACVNTGIIPTGDTWVNVIFSFVDTDKDYFVFGSRSSYNVGEFGAILDSNAKMLVPRIEIMLTPFSTTIAGQIIDLTLNNPTQKASALGQVISSNYAFNGNNYPMALYAYCTGSIGAGSKIDVYSFVVGNANGILQNLLPCVKNSNGEVGFFDTVSGSFFGNAKNDGAFAAIT